MRKPAFCICEKNADDQRLYVCYIYRYNVVESLLFLNPKLQAIFCGCAARFVSDLVVNTEPSVPYVLVTETSSRSIGLEDVCDTCCRRFSSKQTSAARHKNVLAQRPCQHLVETLK